LGCSELIDDLTGSLAGTAGSCLRLENICICLIPPGFPSCKANLVPQTVARVKNT
jgi:hypothetical protein